MNPTERTLLRATALVLVAGGATWLALGGLASIRGARAPVPVPPEPVAGTAPGEDLPPQAPGALARPGSPSDGTARPAGGGIPPGLRPPSGEDLSDPARVKARLRENLAASNPRWDWIAQLLGVLDQPLDADIKAAIETQLVHGNAAGAIQAYERLRDGSVVPDLLKLLDDPTLEDHDRNNILVAVTSIPAGDSAQVVTGIEARLKNDFAHDLPYLKAIAHEGGAREPAAS